MIHSAYTEDAVAIPNPTNDSVEKIVHSRGRSLLQLTQPHTSMVGGLNRPIQRAPSKERKSLESFESPLHKGYHRSHAVLGPVKKGCGRITVKPEIISK